MSAPLRLLLVDDEAPARQRLRHLLADISAQIETVVVAEAADGLSALEYLERLPVDVALIDIRMPRMDGLQLALHLTRQQKRPAIIFVTAFDEYAVRAFDLTATDYLLKPVRAERLLTALLKVGQPSSSSALPLVLQSLVPGSRHHLRSAERGKVSLIPLAEILYFRAELKYVTARTATAEYLLDESLTQLENEFGPRFIRVHRNCLVARHAVNGYVKDRGEDDLRYLLSLAHLDEKIAVSRRQWPQVKAELNL